MQTHRRAIQSYGSVHAAASIGGVPGVQLTQMLFDGLVDSLMAARGHIEHRAIRQKADQLARAGRIVLGLQSTLDFDRGGDIARNLNELYSYVTRRLLHINGHNDLEALDEVTSLIRDIRDAWNTLPGLLGETSTPSRLVAN